MSTVDKALNLLTLFSHDQPEFGLSELSRRSGHDKATTLRHARSLIHSGLLEQDPHSRRYRLGAEILRLANLREGLYPLRALAHPIATELSVACQETVHVSARAGDNLGTVLAHESTHTLRVVVEPGLQMPWHATASGIALLAHLASTEQAHLLETSQQTHSTLTHDALQRIHQAVEQAAIRGYAVSSDRLEHGVSGVAAAFFDNRNIPIGTIAVALSSAELSETRERELGDAVIRAADLLSAQLGATRRKPHPPVSTGRAM